MQYNSGPAEGDIPEAEFEALRARTLERLGRALARTLGQIARDHERCGKAACARSGRCRGFACEPVVDDDGAAD